MTIMIRKHKQTLGFHLEKMSTNTFFYFQAFWRRVKLSTLWQVNVSDIIQAVIIATTTILLIYQFENYGNIANHLKKPVSKVAWVMSINKKQIIVIIFIY